MQGSKKERLSQEESFAAVEEFCMAVHDKWPNCLVQFEGARPAAPPPAARDTPRLQACACWTRTDAAGGDADRSFVP